MSHAAQTEGSACARCGGATTNWPIVHTVDHDGQTVIVEGVPAQVCFSCGETHISDATRAQLQALLRERPVRGTIPFREWKD